MAAAMDLIVAGRRLRLRRSAAGYEVEIDGRALAIDSALVRPGLYSLLIDGRQHEVAVAAEPGGVYRVSTAGATQRIEVADPLSYLAAQAAGSQRARKRQRVTAYMPGRVAAVLAREGQEVAAGTGIVVLEAMKMQNEIQAEHAGVVAHVFVEPGQSVDGGDPLFEIE